MSMYSTISLFGFEQQFTYAGVAELADALALGASVSDVQVQVLSPAPSKGYKKDVAPETPDFIGGFAVSTAEKTTSDFVDVKKVFFPFCNVLNPRTTKYKPSSAWINQVHALFLFPQKGGK